MRLIVLLSTLALLCVAATSRVCHSTICSDPDEHGFCQQTCRSPNEACRGNFFLTPNHTVQPGTFRCHSVRPDECLSTSCQLDVVSPSFGSCCCRTDLCNIIPGLFGDLTPAPPSILPLPPITLPPFVPNNQLVCEFNNCTSSSNTNCYHGYQICAEHPDAGVISQPENHFCAVHASRTPHGLYELHSKGCVLTTDATIRALGSGQRNCVLNTTAPSPQVSCYCDQLMCNNVSNLHFTDPTRFIGTDPDILCDGLGCSHSCVVTEGVPRCLCPDGYALDTDRLTCAGESIVSVFSTEFSQDTNGGYNVYFGRSFQPHQSFYAPPTHRSRGISH